MAELARLPGIGPKTAQRLAFHMLKLPKERRSALAHAIEDLEAGVTKCSVCFNLSEKPMCSVCDDPSRNKKLICVVESPSDVIAIERTGTYSGVYHVLHGVISPLEGVGPDDINIGKLIDRVLSFEDSESVEVIVATNSDMEGEATASYISQILTPKGIKVTRPAHGIPVGSDLEYADEVTLARAIAARHVI
jgi:recombination protein RecR